MPTSARASLLSGGVGSDACIARICGAIYPLLRSASLAAAPIILLAIAAPIALHVEDSRGVSTEDSAAILEVLAKAIEARSGLKAGVDTGEACKKKDRCVEEISARAGATDVVFVRMLGVPTRIRLIAERAVEPRSAELDLPRAREGWEPALASIARSLFDEKKRREEPIAELPVVEEKPLPEVKAIDPIQRTPEPEDSVSYAPWVAIGGGVLALAVGTGFGLSSRGARDEALARPHTDLELDILEDRAIGHGLVADILFGVAAVGVGTGIVLFILED